jgi:hypothetical protein
MCCGVSEHSIRLAFGVSVEIEIILKFGTTFLQSGEGNEPHPITATRAAFFSIAISTSMAVCRALY